jgi:aminoglycoside phosphotransferase (APT) family kinase protein
VVGRASGDTNVTEPVGKSGARHDPAIGDPAGFAASLLESLGLPSSPLQAADGWVNRVWLAPAHVVRCSSGRFRDSLAHEARVLQLLPPEVPHAHVVTHRRTGRREWLVLKRVPGLALTAAWPALGRRQRVLASRQLGGILRALHQVSVPADLRPPSLEDALAPGGARRDAYHALPERYCDLLEAAEAVSGVDSGILREVGAFIAERLDAFAPQPAEAASLVHVDVHFGNVIWDDRDGGRISALLDFEGARSASPDLELDTLLRFAREPELFDWPTAPVHLTRADLAGFVDWLANAYPALFAHPRLGVRLAVYEALWQLVQLFHFPPASGPPDPVGHLQALLSAGSRWAWR